MNPFDIFPRRNLNPEAEEWGRFVEGKIYDLENRDAAGGQSLDGLNRNTAASLADLSGQVQEVAAQVQAVEDLYNALPIAYQQTTAPSNFGLSSGWNTIASVTFTPPRNGTLSLSATASGQLSSAVSSGNAQVNYRLVRASSASPSVAGWYGAPSGNWVSNFSAAWSWNASAGPNNEVTIELQANPTAASTWGSGSGSYAVLSVFAVFNG